MDTLWQDIRYGFRILLRWPLPTCMAILALALGVGATSSIFSLVNTFLLRPLPYQNPDQLVMIWQSNQQRGGNRQPVSYPNFVDWRTQNQVFEEMAAYDVFDYNLTGQEQPERVRATRISANLFSMLGERVAVGRGFLQAEENPGEHRAVILSHGLWQRRFGGTEVLGQTLKLDGENYTIVGVMPQRFEFPPKSRTELWTPLALALDPARRGERYLGALARLKPGITAQTAQAEMSVIARRLEQDYPNTNSGWGVHVVSMHEDLIERGRSALLVLFGAVCFVLLIACANVANLMFARATGRQKEIALRLSLGATRIRLIRQLLTESFVLSLAGGVLGLLCAFWVLNLLAANMPGELTSVREIGLDPRVLGFALLVSLLAGVLSGLAPALQASKPDLNSVLKDGVGNGTPGDPGRQHIRKLLVVVEVALSLVLLIGASLMIQSFLHLQKVDPGFDPQNLLVASMTFPQTQYPDPKQRIVIFQQIVQRLEALPGVKSVSGNSIAPLSGRERGNAFEIEGYPPLPPGERLFGYLREVTPNYFSGMRIPILKGRAFTEQDTEASPWVVIINQTLAQRFFPNEDPIGKRLTFNPGPEAIWYTIVGVVGDVRHAGVVARPNPELYGPYLQDPVNSVSLLIRTAGPPGDLIAAVRDTIQATNKELPATEIRTMEQFIADSIARVEMTTLFLSLFAGVALTLALVGIFAFMSYTVGQQTREIGIRMALGAQPGQVLKLITWQGMKLVLAGVVIGLVLAFIMSRVLTTLLFGVGVFEVATFLGGALLISLVALLAILFPAIRATRVDPMIALRVA